MARAAQRLPHRGVPELHHVPTMRLDLVNHRRCGRATLLETPAHDRCSSTWSHPAERKLGEKRRACAFPPRAIAALGRSPATLLPLTCVCVAPTVSRALAATRRRT